MDKFTIYSGGRRSGKMYKAAMLLRRYGGAMFVRDEKQKQKILAAGLLTTDQIIVHTKSEPDNQ